MIQLKNKFRVIAGEDQLIDKKEFFEGLEISNRILSDRLFDIFDKDKNGKIDHDEFLATIEEIIFVTEMQSMPIGLPPFTEVEVDILRKWRDYGFVQ